MCGIVGVASSEVVRERLPLVAMRDTMRHRGPDDAGEWWSEDGQVGLAQRRLAIIDLSPGGHQPMTDFGGGLCITFNGEIYNYRDLRCELEKRGHSFRSASDTEVVLESYREWGTDFLSRLNGMFALGLYDLGARRLLLARDRAGEKPLFYRLEPGRLVFASELKALMAAPAFSRRLDLESFERYLTYGYVPGERCILDGARKLGQGQALTYDLSGGETRAWSYWSLPESGSAVGPEAGTEELLKELESLLFDSVRRQLLAADVPVGILLSGGVDSSLVTAMAARSSSRPVKTFTITFPGYGTYDEGPYARLVAQHFGTEHTELVAEPASVDLLPVLARQYDEPMADSSMVPTYLVSRLIRQHATVALGGDGGDELFGGYPHYGSIQQQERVRRFVPRWGRALVGSAAARLLPVGFRGRNYIAGFAADVSQSIARVNVYFDRWARRRVLSASVREEMRTLPQPEDEKAARCNPAETALRQATATDFGTYLVDDILVKVDRASMLNSLEVRAPWLDYRLVEFAFGKVPDALRAAAGEKKILPRLLAGRILPPALDLRRKQGFSLPMNQWFSGKWGGFIEEVLREAEPSLFDRRAIRSLIDGQRRGYSNAQRLFALTMFELWRREYRVGLPA